MAPKDIIHLYKKRHSTKGPGSVLRKQLRECLTSHGCTDSWGWNKTGTKKQPRTFYDKKALQPSEEQMNSITQSIQDKRMPFDTSVVNRYRIKWKTKNGNSYHHLLKEFEDLVLRKQLFPCLWSHWGAVTASKCNLQMVKRRSLFPAPWNSYASKFLQLWRKKIANKSIFSHALTPI